MRWICMKMMRGGFGASRWAGGGEMAMKITIVSIVEGSLRAMRKAVLTVKVQAPSARQYVDATFEREKKAKKKFVKDNKINHMSSTLKTQLANNCHEMQLQLRPHHSILRIQFTTSHAPPLAKHTRSLYTPHTLLTSQASSVSSFRPFIHTGYHSALCPTIMHHSPLLLQLLQPHLPP